VQFDTRLPLANGQILTPFARAAWVHEFYPDRGVDSFLTLSPAAFFAGNGVFAAEDVAKVDTGFTLDVTEHTGLFAYFDGELAGNSQSYAGSGGVKIMW
jgi:outer membrane autotransporter protein